MNRTRNDNSAPRKWPSIRARSGAILRLVAAMWLLEIIDVVVLRHMLDHFGIVPRTLSGLPGILLAPLLHRDFTHLVANTGPLLVAGFLILLQGTRVFRVVTLVVWVGGGILEWLLAPPNICSIGASGVVFGYIGFLLANAVVSFRPLPVIAALICAWFYGASILPNVLPTAESAARQVSWHGHLFGFVAGVVAARLVRRR
jgi:membrane associated rhomboid family serine protease